MVPISFLLPFAIFESMSAEKKESLFIRIFFPVYSCMILNRNMHQQQPNQADMFFVVDVGGKKGPPSNSIKHYHVQPRNQ